VVSVLTRLGGAQTEAHEWAGARQSLESARRLLTQDAAEDGSAAFLAEATARLHEMEGRPAEALASWREALHHRSAQIRNTGGPYAWLGRVDFVEASLGLGRALEAEAQRARSNSARGQAFREARSTYEAALPLALSLEGEKRLVGKSKRLVAELRQAQARCDEALGPFRASQLTPARPSP